MGAFLRHRPRGDACQRFPPLSLSWHFFVMFLATLFGVSCQSIFCSPKTLCGVLVSQPPPPSPPPPPPPPLLRRHFVTQQLSNTTLSHTNFVRTIFDTQLCHTLTFTNNSVTQRSSANKTLSHAIFDHNSPPPTQLCHTPSLTQLCHTLSLSHTLCHTPTFHFVTHQLFHTLSLTRGMLRHFAWQAWHLATSTFVSRGRRGTWRHSPSFAWQAWHLAALMALSWLCWRAWAGLVAGDATALCVAGVAQCHIHLRFTWQAWRNVTSTFILRGRRGTYGIGWRAWAGFSRP